MTPAQALEMAYDFSDRRADVWPNVNLKYLDVHELGAASADVTEGMWFLGQMWERCRYEWSDASAVTATVRESNILEPGSTWHFEATDHDGRTAGRDDVRAEVQRGSQGSLRRNPVPRVGREARCVGS